MAFQKKTWVDRLTEFATRRIITNATTRQETLVEVARAEGEIYEPGDAFNADTMNDLEDRINDAFEEVGKGVGVVDTYDNVMDMISHGEIEEETFVSITDDSDDDSISAIAIDYDNTDSGMAATEVQGAIDELKSTTDTLSTNKVDKTSLGWVLLNEKNGKGTANAVSFPTNYQEYSFAYYHSGYEQVWHIPKALIDTFGSGSYRAFVHFYSGNQYEAQVRIAPGSAYIEFVNYNGTAVTSGMSLTVFGRYPITQNS